MPSAIFTIGAKVILGAATAIGVTGTFAVATGLVYAAGVATIVAGGILANKLIKNLFEMPQIDTDAARQRTVKSTIEPQKIIYGEALVSGPITFVGVYGSNNRVLAHAVALAGHEVNDITDIHFDNLVISDSSIDGNGFVTSGVLGPTGGNQFTEAGINFGYNICKIDKHLGAAGQVVDSALNSAFTSITTAHKGTGIAYISTHWLLKDASQEVWDKYSPQNIKALVQGKKVYDPRQDSTSAYYDATVGVSTQRANDSTTWKYSTNPVWCLIDYMTDTSYGMGVSLSRFDLATAVDAADECDEVLSGSYATPSGSQKRFTCNGILFATDTHKTNINKILSSMNGMLTYTNGQFVVRAGAYEAPSVYLDEDNLAGAVSVKTSVERSERFNTITGTFIDPAQNHKATEFPEVYITAARLRDGNEVLTKNIQLPMTNDSYMAQRLAHKLIQQSDQQKVVTFPTNLSGMQVAVGDRVAISLDEFNWSNKVFVCLGWTLSDSGNGGINLILREDDAGSYDDMLTAQYSEITAEGTIDEGFRGVPDPQNLTATAGLKSIELNWDNPENTSDILFIEVFASPDSSWANRVKIGEVDGTQFTHDESNAADPVAIDDTRYYWIRARAMPTGESAIAVSDRNPDNDTSTITATVGALPWDDVAGDAKPEDNANNTYVDGNGDIQGVSSGAGTSVDNSLNIGKTLALCLNQYVSGAANQGECAIVGVDNEGNIDRTKDGHILWNGSKITIDRDQYSGFTVLTNLANKRGFICFDTTKSQPFTVVVDVDVVFAYKQGGQWYYDNNSATPVSFTPTDDYVALGWLETGTADTVVRGGLLGEPVSLTTASFPSDVIESGTIGGIIVDYNKLYDGAGNYENADTGFYLDSTGKFSLKDKLAFDGTDLTVQGAVNASTLNVVDATVTGSLKASTVSAGSITVESLTQGVWNEIDNRFSAIVGSTGGFYEEDTGVFAGTAINITTGQLAHNTKDIVFQVSVDEYWVDDVNFSGTQLQAVLTIEYSTNGTTWNTVTDGTNNASTTLTATSYTFSWGGETTYIFYLQSGYLFTVPYAQLAAGNYYFRARITPSNATNAFASATYLPAGGLTFTFESNESVSGVVATGGSTGNADTLDGLHASSFLRSDQSDSTSGSLTVGGDLTVTGDLTINGTTTTLNTATLQVEDKNIVLNYGDGDTSASADGAGITIQDAVNSTTDATILWDATNDEFDFSHAVSVSGDISGTDITASGTVTASGGDSDDWNTAYSWGDHAAEGYLTAGGDFTSGDITLAKTGTATSTTTEYNSHEIFFNGSGWSTSLSTARDVGFIVRGETEKNASSGYANFSLAFYEGPTATYTQKKFELYGYDTGTQDNRSASFFGTVDINATSDGGGGDFKIGGTTIIDQARNLSNIGTIETDDRITADIIAFANSGVSYGMYSNHSARGDGNYTYVKAMYGIANTVNSASNTAIDIDHLTGVSGAVLAFQSNVFSGTSINIDNLYGVQSEISIQNTATSNTLTINNLYGLYAGTPTQGGSATATSAYGLYIGDYSSVGSTDNYAIYAAGGETYLGGNVVISSSGTIGTNTPSNGYLQITDGTSTLAFDTNEIYTNASGALIITTDGTGIRVDSGTVSSTTINNWNLANAYRLIGHLPLSGGTVTGDVTIYKEAAYPTLLTLHNYQSDINPNAFQGNFIDFKMTDDNATFTPQVRIGMVVEDYSGDAGIPSEGTGNFVVYTSQGTDEVGGGSLSERFRVAETGELVVSGVAFIDSIRNLKNIRTISSGAITASSNYSGGSGDFTNVTAAPLKITNTSGYLRIPHISAHETMSTVYNYETGKDVYFGESTDTGNYFLRGRDVDVVSGSLKVGGTTVIDSSRNLTNIAAVTQDLEIKPSEVTNAVKSSNGVLYVEGAESQIQVIANDGGSWASNIVLSNFNSTTAAARHYWIHNTPSTSSVNAGKFELRTSTTTTDSNIGGQGTDSAAILVIDSSGNANFTGSVTASGSTLTGDLKTTNIQLSSTTPTIFFNGTADGGDGASSDMAIKATPDGLDFYEPEDNNKIQFQILDDTGVNAPFGYKVGGTTVIDSDRKLINITYIDSIRIPDWASTNDIVLETYQQLNIGDYSDIGFATLADFRIRPNDSTTEFTFNENYLDAPSYQVSGTSVIDSSRNLTNIGSITATSDSNFIWRTTTNAAGVTHEFSDNASGSYGQKGYINYYHGDSVSHGSGNAFTITSTEPSLSFAVDGKVISKDGFYVGFDSGNNGTQVIDSNRNLTNIGTISSGAITSTGTSSFANFQLSDSSKMGFGTVKASATVGHNASVDEGIFWHTTNGYGIYRTAGNWTSPDYSQLKIAWNTGITLYGGNNSSYTYHGVNLENTALKVNNTVVLDVNRNLTNIGTVSSGVITAEGASGGKNLSYASNFAASDASIQLTLERTDSGTGWGGIGADVNYCFAAWDATPTRRFTVTHAGVADATSGYQVDGTTVIDDSRNLTNIADITISGKYKQELGANSAPQSTDYFYIGGDDLAGADAAMYIGNRGDGTGYGWRLYYYGTGSDNANDFAIQSENLGSPVDAVRFNQDGTATFASDIIGKGDIYVNQGNGSNQYLWINRSSTSDGGILFREDNILKFQNRTSGDDLFWYSYETSSQSFFMYGSGEFSAKSGYQVDGTTVIDSSRNLTNIGSIDSTGRLTITNSSGGDGTWSGGILIKNTNATAGEPAIAFQNSAMGGNYWIVGSNQDNEMHFSYGSAFQDGNSKVVIKSDGKMGINRGAGEFSNFLEVGGSILATGDITAFSDERLKSNIQTLDGSKVLDMRGVSFTKDGVKSSGVIAQELEKVAPELVHTSDDEIGTKSVAYGNLVGYLIEAIKDQRNEIDELKALVKTLMEK